MSRSLKLYFEDILNSCHKIIRYTEGLEYEEFIKDDLRLDAVLRNIQIIGEAIKQVPPEFRSHYPLVEWRKIARLRDIIAHNYFSLKDEIIWDVVKNKVPLLQEQIETIFQQEFRTCSDYGE
jgi:uncharacterized protein with HEPN domain